MLNKNEERASKYSLAIIKVQEAISNIIGSAIEFELVGGPLNVFVKWNDTRLTFEVLPDGLKSIISWLGNLLMRMYRLQWAHDEDVFDRNFILFLDEIDIHLHPAWQRKILPVVKKLFRNAQIFISTHSPFVVGSVDGAWVYKLKKEGQYCVLDGEPVPSNSAKSYRLVLDVIFDIKEDFGVEVEKKIQHFYLMRKEILEGKRSIEDKAFKKLVKELASRSIELESIVVMEVRQLERISKQKELRKAL
jgi:predicted ATP-binding protein involved in virulence